MPGPCPDRPVLPGGLARATPVSPGTRKPCPRDVPNSRLRGRAGRSLTRISWSHAELGEYQLALTCGNDALGLHQNLANLDGQASTWHGMGFAHYRLGQYAQALTCYHHALILLQDLGNRFYEAQVLVGLGDTHHGHGNLDAAGDAWRQALIIFDDLHHARAAAVRTRLRTLAPPTLTPSARAESASPGQVE
ncbi:tetratricopeptide repeat protein [Micromonospora sp. NPDC048835]|uniref:tetratricopeptide repeat protein n=1 Tax=Micromonospora sp. NPDC048835 TaxID=3155147 RepID=UPI0033EEEE93